MRPLHLILGFATAASLVAGCLIEVDDPAGSPCESREVCQDVLYDCVAPAPEAQRVCQLIYPPRPVTDAGTDAGPVEPVFWCNDVEALLTTYCAACHGEDRSASGNQPFRLDRYDDDIAAMPPLAGAKTKALRIKARTSDGVRDMPPFGSPLPTDEERVRISHWVQGGAELCADGGP